MFLPFSELFSRMSTLPKFEFIDVTNSTSDTNKKEEKNNEMKVTSNNRYLCFYNFLAINFSCIFYLLCKLKKFNTFSLFVYPLGLQNSSLKNFFLVVCVCYILGYYRNIFLV